MEGRRGVARLVGKLDKLWTGARHGNGGRVGDHEGRWRADRWRQFVGSIPGDAVNPGAHATNIAREAAEAAGIRLEVVPKEPGRKTFEAPPRRRGVERTFAWLVKYRRPRAGYENTGSSSCAWILLATASLMARRLRPA